ncbi:MAG: RlmE family RNA methyltransferase, partial [Candidatus Bathyarchaeia archaeon]
LDYSNVHSIVGDIREPELTQRIKAILPHPADVVISDVSPHVSGIWELDHARQIELAESSLKIATSILKNGGNFFVKLFQGDMADSFLRKVRNLFSFVKVIKPKASRAESAEIYVLGMGLQRSKMKVW